MTQGVKDLIADARQAVLTMDYDRAYQGGLVGRLADALEASLGERDAALAAVERVRAVLVKWEAQQELNREILGSGGLGHFQAIDCTGDLRAALDGTPEPEWETVAEYGVKYAPTNNRASYTVRFGYESREDAEHSLGRLGRNQKRNPDRLMYREVRTGPWLPVKGESK